MSSKLRLAIAAVAVLGLAVPAAAVARHGHHGHTQSTVTGTVASFKNATLTIAQADGTLVSAKVTGATEIECEGVASTPIAATADRHGDGSGSGDSSRSRGHGDDTVAENAEAPENEAAEPAGEDRNDAAGSTTTAGSTTACDRTALTAGAVVTRARIASGGFFKQIKLTV